MALTRTHAAEEMLVVKPFPKALFQQGPRLEIELLHAKLRGEDITERLEDYEMQKQQRKAQKQAETQQNKEMFDAKRGATRGKRNSSEVQGDKSGAAKSEARCNICKQSKPLAQFGVSAIQHSTKEKKNNRSLICTQCAQNKKGARS